MGDLLMKSKDLRWTVRAKAVLVGAALVMLAIGAGGLTRALATGPQLPAQFTGLLNDYTPANAAVSGTPYEMHGKWTLAVSPQGEATFAAEMSMETADFANADPSDPTKLGAHTHHISVMDGVVHDEPTDPINWKSSCPTFKPPAAGGFVVTGNAWVTGNGGPAPFGNPSPVTICILGGLLNLAAPLPQPIVQFSNFTLQFGAGSHASTHFGGQPINGVVVKCENASHELSIDCEVNPLLE
jgi:hypothetical protein